MLRPARFLNVALSLAAALVVLGATPPEPAIVKVEGAELCAGLPIRGGWVLAPLRCLPWDVYFPKVRVDGAPASTIARENGVSVVLAKAGGDAATGWPIESLYTGSMGPWFDRDIRCEGYEGARGSRVTVHATVKMEAMGLVGLEGPKLPARFSGVCFIDDDAGPQPLGTASGDAGRIAVRRVGALDAWIGGIVDPQGGHEAPSASAPVESDPLRGYMMAATRWTYTVLRMQGQTMGESQTIETWSPLGVDSRGNAHFSVITTEDRGHGPHTRPAQEFTLGPDGMRIVDGDALTVLLPPNPRPGAAWKMGSLDCSMQAETTFCADGLAAVCWEGGESPSYDRSHYCPGQGWRGQDSATLKDGEVVSRARTSVVRRDGRAAWPDVCCAEDPARP